MTWLTAKEPAEWMDVWSIFPMNGMLQDREFFAKNDRGGREPNSSVAQVLPCYRVLTNWSNS